MIVFTKFMLILALIGIFITPIVDIIIHYRKRKKNDSTRTHSK